MENKNKSIVIVVLVSLVFGLIGGVSGELFSRAYLLKEAYKVPLFGEIDVNESIYGGSNLIIESPKKVVVEQNTKVLETLRSAQKNIVGIFERIETSENQATTTVVDIDNYYDLRDAIAQGFVITSDGWVMSNFAPLALASLKDDSSTSTKEKLIQEIATDYVLLSQDGEVFDVLDIKVSDDETLSFWQVEANDFSVRQFEKVSEIEKGQLVIASNFDKTAWLTSVANKYKDLPSVLSSDRSYANISLTQDLSEDFGDGFLFNIDGDLIALIDEEKNIRPVSSYFSCLACLLDNKDLKNAKLGVNYIDLSRFADPKDAKVLGEGAMVYPNQRGIAIVKNSPAEIAGLKEGDIITAVNTIKLDANNNLSDLVATMRVGEKINLAIIRDKKEMQLVVILTEEK